MFTRRCLFSKIASQRGSVARCGGSNLSVGPYIPWDKFILVLIWLKNSSDNMLIVIKMQVWNADLQALNPPG